MLKPIHIVYDISGSMIELGKPDIIKMSMILLKNKIKYLSQTSFYYWNSQLISVSLGTQPHFFGKSDCTVLIDFLKNLPQNSCVILLSDGNFDISSNEIVAENKKKCIYSVSIGSDADLDNLKKISSNGFVYSVSDIGGVFDRISNYCFN